MQKQRIVKMISLVFIIALVMNMILLAMRKISPLTFWLVLISIAIIVWVGKRFI